MNMQWNTQEDWEERVHSLMKQYSTCFAAMHLLSGLLQGLSFILFSIPFISIVAMPYVREYKCGVSCP